MTDDVLIIREERIGRIRLNRPKAMNALSPELMRELGHALDAFAADDNIGAIVITDVSRMLEFLDFLEMPKNLQG